MIKSLLLSAALGSGVAPAPAQVDPPGAAAEDAAPSVAGLADILRRNLGDKAVFLSADEVVILEPTELALEDFLWIARPLVIFADSPKDPRFIQQMEYIDDRFTELAERDVVVIVDTDPAAHSAIREALRPRGFDLVLIGKDGFKYLRKPVPWDVREISRSIDKMPMRRQELKDMRGR